jgi:hypothetical protein
VDDHVDGGFSMGEDFILLQELVARVRQRLAMRRDEWLEAILGGLEERLYRSAIGQVKAIEWVGEVLSEELGHLAREDDDLLPDEDLA